MASNFFDAEDVVQPAVSDRREKGRVPQAPSTFFDQADVVAPVQPPEPVGVEKEIQQRSWFNRPVIGTEKTSRADIEQIAQKHGVDPEKLTQLAPYFGARMEDSNATGLAKEAAGTLGAIGLGIPQKLYKKGSDPAMERALDDVQALASGRKSYVQELGEAVAAPIGGAGSSLVKGLAKGAAIGAAAGAAAARQGEEVQGAATGAALGAGTTALGRAAQRLLSGKAAKVEQEAAQGVLAKSEAELNRGAEEVLAQRRASEDAMDEIIRGKRELDQPAAQAIVREQMDPELVQRYTDSGTVEGRLIRQRLASGVPEEVQSLGMERAIERNLANSAIENRASDFVQDLTKGKVRPKSLDEARSAMSEYADRLGGPEHLGEKYKLFSEEQAALDHINRNAVRAGRGDNFKDKALNFISDNQFVLRGIDDQFGTDLETTAIRMNQANNRMSFARNEARDELVRLFKDNKPIDQELTQGSKVYNALDTGDTSGLSPQELKAYQGFRNYFKSWLGYVNQLVKTRDPSITPLSIPARENYVPHMLKDTDSLAKEFSNRMQALGDMTQLSRRDLGAAAKSSPEVKELIEGLKLLDNRPIESGADLMARYKDLFQSRGGRVRLDSMAKAALERSGEIPLWMRETNMYKLADSWASNTLKHLYLRNQIDRLASLSRRIEKAGGELESKYVNELLQDINGVRKGTAAEYTNQFRGKYLSLLDKVEEQHPVPGVRAAVGVAKALPDVLSDMTKQVYPNLLGLNPKAIIQNATQVLTKTAPELGGSYGYSTALRGALHFAANKAAMMDKVDRLGLSPAEFIPKYRRVVSDGIRRSALYAVPNQVLNKAGEAAMFAYSKLDKYNRALSLSMAEMMAHDLSRGSKAALAALKRMPGTVKHAVGKASSPEQVAEIIGSYLNASTQYNYNRMSMSQWGRTMGPLFSTFSKWPTATAGELIQEFRQKGAIRGAMRGAEKFVAPLALLQLADIMLFGEQWPMSSHSEKEKSDVLRKFVGKYGLSSAAPIGSIKAIATGDFFTPPAVDAVVKGVVVPALSGDTSKLMRGLDSALYNFTPGAVYVKFLTDDILTYGTGHQPEGSTFLERTERGAKKLGR